jgi:hypothetical protein
MCKLYLFKYKRGLAKCQEALGNPNVELGLGVLQSQDFLRYGRVHEIS